MNQVQKPIKNWWRPLWRGLIVDPEAKHYKRLGPAIWLYLYCILHADTSGLLRRRYDTLAADTGVKKETLRKWLQRLKARHYITVETTGNTLVIHIVKWKMFHPVKAG